MYLSFAAFLLGALWAALMPLRAIGDFRGQGEFRGANGQFCYEFSDTGSMASCTYSSAQEQASRKAEDAEGKGRDAESRAGQAAKAAEALGEDQKRAASQLSGLSPEAAQRLRSEPYRLKADVPEPLRNYVSEKLPTVGDLVDKGGALRKGLMGYASHQQEIAAEQFRQAGVVQAAMNQLGGMGNRMQARSKGMSSLPASSLLQAKAAAAGGASGEARANAAGDTTGVRHAELGGESFASREKEAGTRASFRAAGVGELGERGLASFGGSGIDSGLRDFLGSAWKGTGSGSAGRDAGGKPQGPLVTADEEIGQLSALLGGDGALGSKAFGASSAAASEETAGSGLTIFQQVSRQYRKRERRL